MEKLFWLSCKNYDFVTELNKKAKVIQVAKLLTVIDEDAREVIPRLLNGTKRAPNRKSLLVEIWPILPASQERGVRKVLIQQPQARIRRNL